MIGASVLGQSCEQERLPFDCYNREWMGKWDSKFNKFQFISYLDFCPIFIKPHYQHFLFLVFQDRCYHFLYLCKFLVLLFYEINELNDIPINIMNNACVIN